MLLAVASAEPTELPVLRRVAAAARVCIVNYSRNKAASWRRWWACQWSGERCQ